MSGKPVVVVVGGVAGGASAAARSRRLSEDAEIILFERGAHVSFANCGLPYHIGGEIEDRDDLLLQTPESLKRRFGIDVRVGTEVLAIDRQRKLVSFRNVRSGIRGEQAYDFLVLSPGAEPIRPPFEGNGLPGVFTLRNMGDMDAIQAAMANGKPETALVAGGGYIGLEMAEALVHRGVKVVLAELAGQVMGPADPEMAHYLHQELKKQGVDLRLKAGIQSLRRSGNLLDASLGDGSTVSCGIVILALGVRPETQLARSAGLEIGKRGGIHVDGAMRTSDPSIFAVGDAVEIRNFTTGQETLVPLAGPANRQGRIAADNIFALSSTYKATQGTAICKVFGIAFGMTGMSEKALQAAGMRYEKIYLHPAQHAGYFPGAAPMHLKLCFDPADGKILGFQAVGPEGVDKRVDVLATAQRAGLGVRDLADLELAYAPPYGSAKDPVNFLGFVASNVMDGRMGLAQAGEAMRPGPGQAVLDVRTSGEVARGTVAGSIHIPVDELRGRLGELPRDKEFLVLCQVGLRAYLACRILAQNGFGCRGISGGWATCQTYQGLEPSPA